jgi:hypothetical protein
MMWINMVALFYNPRIVLLVYSRFYNFLIRVCVVLHIWEKVRDKL